ncbi:MAG: YceI family protein [Polaribacter sp.]
MKKIVISLIVFSAVLTACKGRTESNSVDKKEKIVVKKIDLNTSELNNLDLTSSTINWKGTKPTGSHDGTIALKSGNLIVENGKLTKGLFVVDMNTITNLDMKGSDGATKIEGHLKSSDFFDVSVYPTSKFVITNVEEKDAKIAVTGNLQIKDVTKSITMLATISTQDSITTFKSDTFTINRADFNVKYKSKSFFKDLKDKFVDDLVEMSFEIKTKKS